MIKFTEEQMKVLKEASIHFESVLKHNLIRNAPRHMTEDIVRIYELQSGQTVKRNFSCGTCVMNIYRMIGKAYYEYVEYLNKNINEEDKNANTKTDGREVLGSDTTIDNKNRKRNRKNKDGVELKKDSGLDKGDMGTTQESSVEVRA